eukprot:3811016-Prymnesium_polylepis.1
MRSARSIRAVGCEVPLTKTASECHCSEIQWGSRSTSESAAADGAPLVRSNTISPRVSSSRAMIRRACTGARRSRTPSLPRRASLSGAGASAGAGVLCHRASRQPSSSGRTACGVNVHSTTPWLCSRPPNRAASPKSSPRADANPSAAAAAAAGSSMSNRLGEASGHARTPRARSPPSKSWGADALAAPPPAIGSTTVKPRLTSSRVGRADGGEDGAPSTGGCEVSRRWSARKRARRMRSPIAPLLSSSSDAMPAAVRQGHSGSQAATFSVQTLCRDTPARSSTALQLAVPAAPQPPRLRSKTRSADASAVAWMSAGTSSAIDAHSSAPSERRSIGQPARQLLAGSRAEMSPPGGSASGGTPHASDSHRPELSDNRASAAPVPTASSASDRGKRSRWRRSRRSVLTDRLKWSMSSSPGSGRTMSCSVASSLASAAHP